MHRIVRVVSLLSVGACAGAPKLQPAPAAVPASLQSFTKGAMPSSLASVMGDTPCAWTLTSPDGAIRLMLANARSESAARSTSINGGVNTSSAPGRHSGDYRLLAAGAWQIPPGRMLRVDCGNGAVLGTVPATK